jgi:hypothetical protein
LAERWREAWPAARDAWSRYARLREPILCDTPGRASEEGLGDGLAMIRLDDHRIVVSLPKIAALGLEDLALPILAHEAGHHVYAPGDLTDQGNMIARARRSLPGKESLAPLALNLWTDLLVNDRLAREKDIDVAGVYSRLAGDSRGELWRLYMRACELLWGLERGRLAREPKQGTTRVGDKKLEADASLVASLVRSYSRDFVRGSGKFAAVILPYLELDYEQRAGAAATLDALEPGADIPDGLVDEESLDGDGAPASRPGDPSDGASSGSRGQARTPFEYGEILKAMGIRATDEEIASRYYRERALPHLVPFPERPTPKTSEPFFEGWEEWDIGTPIDRVDWLASIRRSPALVPGYTLLERVEAPHPDGAPESKPLWLDLYVDSSGSMPDPRRDVSYLTLAGAIVALSALRAGAKVQATLWASKSEVLSTNGFTRDEASILAALVGYFGGGTQFPLHVLRETHDRRGPSDEPVHVFCISDEGIDTMLDSDERGTPGFEIARKAAANGGGTLALQLWDDWRKNAKLKRLADAGFVVARVRDYESLVAFAREFASREYGRPR